VKTVLANIVLNQAQQKVVIYDIGAYAEALVETRYGAHATRHTQTAQAT
jgi:hypothetical protein